MSVAVVAGNPKPRSRTLAAGVLLAETLTGSAPDLVIDVIDLGPGLLAWGDPGVAEAVAAVVESDVVIFASPTFKATYTGLLKLFLDQIPTDGLAGVYALPLMLGAGPGHALAPKLLLTPVLTELGAITPARGLYLVDKTFAEDPQLTAYADRVRPLPISQGG